jgi:hypothetical protein
VADDSIDRAGMIHDNNNITNNSDDRIQRWACRIGERK